MFERFTDRARRVAVLSQEEARFMQHNYIGTEHLLLAMLHEGEGVAAQVLGGFGLELADLRRAVEENIPRGSVHLVGHIPFTPRAKKVLELALREALQLGHSFIGTEHILLGVVREGDGAGMKILREAGIEPADVRRSVVQMLSGYTPREVTDPGLVLVGELIAATEDNWIEWSVLTPGSYGWSCPFGEISLVKVHGILVLRYAGPETDTWELRDQSVQDLLHVIQRKSVKPEEVLQNITKYLRTETNNKKDGV